MFFCAIYLKNGAEILRSELELQYDIKKIKIIQTETTEKLKAAIYNTKQKKVIDSANNIILRIICFII